MGLSDTLSSVGLVVTVISVVVAVVAINKGARNASASAIVTMNAEFRTLWNTFLFAEQEREKAFYFSELLNLYEIACGIYLENSLSGVSRELIGEYITETLAHIENSDDCRRRLGEARTGPTTFKYLKKFLMQTRIKAIVLVAGPLPYPADCFSSAGEVNVRPFTPPNSPLSSSLA